MAIVTASGVPTETVYIYVVLSVEKKEVKGKNVLRSPVPLAAFVLWLLAARDPGILGNKKLRFSSISIAFFTRVVVDGC